MRAAQIRNGVVINYAVVDDYFGEFIDPKDSVLGSTWDGVSFTHPPVQIVIPSVQEYIEAVQKHLDSTAQTKGYDGILSGVSYVGDDDPQFAAEGSAMKAWRSAVWVSCIATLDSVNNGAEPPIIQELIDSLPAIVWP